MAKQGVGALDTISGDDVAKLPPLPYHHTPLSKAYAERLQMVGLRSKNVVAAQCLWDAAMAHSCLDFLKTNTRDAIMLVCGAFHVQHFLGVVDHVEKYTESGGPFEPLERDEFRVVVCVPMDGPSFLRRSLVDVWDDPSLDTVADFIVFTRGGHGGGRRASAPLRDSCKLSFHYIYDSDARHTHTGYRPGGPRTGRR